MHSVGAVSGIKAGMTNILFIEHVLYFPVSKNEQRLYFLMQSSQI